MKMTIGQAFEMIARGETPERYETRMRKLRRYCNERDELQDALSVLTEPEDQGKAQKKRSRLEKVCQIIESIK